MVALAGFRRRPGARVATMVEVEHWVDEGVTVLASPKRGFAPHVPARVVLVAADLVVLESLDVQRFAVRFDAWSFWQGF